VPNTQPTRRLAAILFTDIVGSTTMMQKDEQSAVSINNRYVTVLKQLVSAHHGEILNDYGDGSLCTFSSATQAVRCAMEMQQEFQLEPKVPLRMGLHVGEIFFENEKVFGDGVNVASRVQSIGVANSILFSSEINSKIKNQQEFKSVLVGRFHFKNVDEPMEVFALANEGFIVPNKKKIEGKLLEKKSSAKKTLVTFALFLIAGLITFFVYRQFFRSVNLANKEKFIAVLPFTNMSSDKDNEYFSDGMTDETITQVSKIVSLKVISRSSAMQYKNTKKPLKQIAEELGVSFILLGGIQKLGDSVRINAQLIDAATDQDVWAEKYDRNIKELFAIQSDVAQNIANALQTKLSPTEKINIAKHYTENVEAYKLYRKGRWFWDKRSKDSYDSAEAYYLQAIQLDPDYALAYAGLADCYTYNQKGLSQLEAIPIASDYTSNALMLDSNLAEALTTKAFIQSHFNYDWKGAKVIFEKIIRDNPNYALAHLYYGNVLFFTGNSQAGINETKKALALDPLSSVINMVLGREYYESRNYEQAITQLEKTIHLNPKFVSAYIHLGYALLQKKLYPQAIEAFSKLPPKSFDLGFNGTLLLSYAYSVSGDKKKGQDEFAKISKEDYQSLSPAIIAQFDISMGNFDEALTQLERGYNIHSMVMIALKIDPVYDPIRNEPRFKALLKKAGFE
jgi:adenylate cyclase